MLLRRVGIPLLTWRHVLSCSVKRLEKIAGWVRMSRNNILHGGPMSLSNPFFNWQYLGPFWSSALPKWKSDRKLIEMAGAFRAPKF